MIDEVKENVMKQIEELDAEMNNPDSASYHSNQFRSHVIQRLEDDDNDR